MIISIIYFTLAVFISIVAPFAHASDRSPLADIPFEIPLETATTENPETILINDVGQENNSARAGDRHTISQYQEIISGLEASHGAYNAALSEELMDLGMAQSNQGQYAEAVKSFTRSLHIKRINQGLYSLNQLPILELIIESNTALSDLEALARNYQYYYWIHRRNYGDNDPRLLPVLEKLGQWHLNAYQMGDGSAHFDHLVKANALFNKVVHIIETNRGPSDPGLIEPLYISALTAYEIAVYAANADDLEDIRSSMRQSMSEYERLLEEQGAREQIISTSYRNGKKAINKAIDVFMTNPQLPLDDHANALIHLGDWNMLFSKKTTAMKNYEQAYALLSRNGMEAGTINSLLGRPRSLPAIKLTRQYIKQSADSNYAIALFDISKTGQPRNIQIIETNPADDTSLQRKAKKSIKATRFRPRFENGQPVPTTNVNIRYIFE